MDYLALRKKMVEEQLVGRGIKDKKVLNAFEKIERHRFVPEEIKDSAYGDFPIPIGEGQTISQPYIAALMTECLSLKGEEKVLEIGTGSGFQTAVLAELAKEIYSVERFDALSRNSEGLLNSLGYKNIKLKVGDGSLGWDEFAPFDRIIITAASPRIPLPLTDQLKNNGKMVIPLGETLSQILTIVEKREDKIGSIQVCGCVFVPLVGKFGYH